MNLHWKSFWYSFIPVFIIVVLQHMGIVPPVRFDFSNFEKVEQKPSVMNTVKPLLAKKQNTYSLHKASHIVTQSYASSPYNTLAAYAVVDYDTGEVLLEKDAWESLPMASLTKVMTAVVALDLARPQELLTITPKAAGVEPTKLGMIPGQKMTIYELLQGTLLTSANDAAAVIAQGIDKKYNDKVFIQAMNEKARILGLTATNFDNPQGFDSRQTYSSAADLAILSHYALEQYPVIAEIVKQDYVFLPANGNHKHMDLYNWNGLMGVYPGVLGLKIGNTSAAGNTTIVVSKRQAKDGAFKKILVVVLGASGVLERDLAASELLDIGFEHVAGLPKLAITEKQLQEKYDTWEYF